MYKADADSIKFNGKKVKADPATFKILDERFATDKATVFYEGRPQKGVLSESFRILDEYFVKDSRTVFLVMQSKLKPLKVKAETFEALGFGFGRDDKTALHLDKRVACKASELEPVSNEVALDSQGVFWTHRRVMKKPMKGRPLRVLFGDNTAYFCEPEGVWISQGHYTASLMPEADPESFRLLQGDYTRDRERLYWRSELVTTLGEEDPEFREFEEPLVIINGKTVVCRRFLLPEVDPAESVMLETYVLDPRGVYHCNGAPLGLFGSSPSGELEKVLRDCLDYQLTLHDNCAAFGNNTDIRDIPAESRYQYQVEFAGEKIRVVMDGLEVEGEWHEIPILASRLWTGHHCGEEFYRFIHETRSAYPKGTFQLEALFEVGGSQLLDAARLNESETALDVLTRQMLTAVYYSKREPYLCHSTFEILKRNLKPREYSGVTTNQARAKEILANKEHLSPVMLERHRAAGELYGLVTSSSKTEASFKNILPGLLQAFRSETDSSCRLQWLAAVDMLMAGAWLRMNRGEGLFYKDCLEPVELLVEQSFNLELNLARLWELNEFSQRDNTAVLERLKRVVDDRRMAALWSGLNLDFPCLAAWLMGARLRLIWAKPEKERLAYAQETLAYLEKEIEDWKEPGKVADLLCSLERLLGGLKGLGRELHWPEESLYTRQSAVGYLIERAPYRVERVDEDERGFILRGWPLGRRVQVIVGEKELFAWIGLRQIWPGRTLEEIEIPLRERLEPEPPPDIPALEGIAYS